MSRSRRATVTAAFAIAAVLAGPGSALPAHAATCNGATCNNLDPHDAGCDTDKNIKNLDDRTANNVRYVLRYSPACDAAWVKYSFINRGPGAGDISVQKKVKPPYRDAYWATVSTESTAYNDSGWTNMVGGNAANTVVVRGKLYTQGGAATGYYYTNEAPI
ncbi:MAG: hypothetical protein QG608_1019 [Actinomycetota bacterium]|nr:hypothetical protein [Actinomycetota bacterium]